MAYSTAVRTLRDGSIKIKDGAMTPKVCTVVCDDGNLQWTERVDIREQRCRGTLYGTRRGDDQPIQLRCTFKWQQLIQASLSSANPITPYEMLNDIGGSFTSTDTNHDYVLLWEFTVVDPKNGALCDEKIAFSKVAKEEITCAEGDEYNRIDFSGRDYGGIIPTITRVA